MFHSTFKISPSFQKVLIEDSNLLEKYRFFFQDKRFFYVQANVRIFSHPSLPPSNRFLLTFDFSFLQIYFRRQLEISLRALDIKHRIRKADPRNGLERFTSESAHTNCQLIV